MDATNESMTLREAAQRTSRSITTLRRYIRAGRLRADMRQGRYGPEYFVSPKDLEAAGMPTEPSATEALVSTTPISGPVAPIATPADVREAVPMTLYQELQMKHEQLLVQYGMVRAGGIRVFELRGELEATQRELDGSREQVRELQRRLAEDTGRLKQELRRAALEQHGRGLELSALREKVRALEMLTRNAVTNESIEKRFSEVMEQARRVDRLSRGSADKPRERSENPDH